MSILKIGWGFRITVLYLGFATLIIALVVGSMRQDFDLVADDYYAQELAYQDVLDAGKNQSGLSQPVGIHANETQVTVDFPVEFNGKALNGTVYFYSPIEDAWDKKIALENSVSPVIVPRSELQNTNYKIKITWEADGKQYYQESDITLF